MRRPSVSHTEGYWGSYGRSWATGACLNILKCVSRGTFCFVLKGYSETLQIVDAFHTDLRDLFEACLLERPFGCRSGLKSSPVQYGKGRVDVRSGHEVSKTSSRRQSIYRSRALLFDITVVREVQQYQNTTLFTSRMRGLKTQRLHQL